MIAVVLAAGRSTRMGRPKLHLPWGATTMLGQVLATLRAAGLDDIVLAARQDDERAAATALGAAAEVVRVSGDDGAPTRSLQAALAHIAASQRPRNDGSILVMPGDMPLIEPATIANVVAAFHREPDPRTCIVAPELGGRRGHPVIFGEAHARALAALGVGEQPRAVVQRAGARVRLVAVDDIGVRTDIDDGAAYERWRPRRTRPS